MARPPVAVLRDAPDADIGNPTPKQRPVQVLRFDLPQDLLDELLKCHGKEHSLQVSFGKAPSLRYGKTSIDLQISPSPHRNELYQHSSTGKAKDFDFGGLVTHSVALRKDEDPTADMDSALATLQQQMASISKEKQSMQSTLVNEVKPGKRTTTTGKRGLPAHRRNMFSGDAGRASVTSPSLGATLAAPSTSQTSTAQSSKTSAMRTPLLHLLAVKPLSEVSVAKKLHIPKQLCLNLLEKYAKRSEPERLWQLTDRWYKELDIWKFSYDPATSDRQSAIDNAVRAYDRMRLSRDNKLWQLLLPKDQRGKGVVLSKLNLSNFNAIRTSTPKPEPSSLGSDTITIVAPEPMARTKSNDNSTKDILSKRTATRTSANVTRAAQTPRATKAKAGARKPAPNVKSAEFVQDSDEEAADDVTVDELSNESLHDEKSKRSTSTPAKTQSKTSSEVAKKQPAAAGPKTKADLPAEAAKTRVLHSGSVSSDSSLTSISSISSPHHQHASSISSTGSTSSPNKKRRLTEPPSQTSPPSKTVSPVKAISSGSTPKGQTSPSRLSLFANSQIKAAKAVPRNVARPGVAHRPTQEVPAKRPAVAETDSRDDDSSRKKPRTDSKHSSLSSRPQHDMSKLPEPSIVDLQERKRDVQREYITLHLEVSNASNPSESKVQEVWKLFDELNRLKQEISRKQGSPLDLDESAHKVRLDAKTTTIAEKQFSQEYPIYKKLYDELANMAAPPADQMAELWAMQGHLSALQQLMDDNSKDTIIEKVRIDMNSPADPESPTVPLSRRQTLDLYRKYHKYFAAYEKQNAVLQAAGSVSMQEVDDDWKMRIRLEDMRREIVRGFEHMTRGFEMEGTGDEEFVDEEDPDLSSSSLSSDEAHGKKELSESEMRATARRFADEWPQWFALRSKLLAAPFGTVDPDAMADLWSRQCRLKRWRWQVFRASKVFPCEPKLA